MTANPIEPRGVTGVYDAGTGCYTGFQRPWLLRNGIAEASYMIERLIDIAADEMGIDPAELRRRDTIPPKAMPYKTPLTFTYDTVRSPKSTSSRLLRCTLHFRVGSCAALKLPPT
jgi:CO/xanthine dehydrogenase Mo-binding subunit